MREGIERRRIYVTGNPIKEVLDHYAPQIEAADPFTEFGVEPGKYFLVTAHRAETVDDPDRLASLIEALNDSHREVRHAGPRLAAPAHRRQDARSSASTPARIRFVPPLGLFDFVRLEKEAFCVLSDSGTVQEECCIFGVPTVTLRDVTERPETIECGSNLLAGVEAERILPAIDLAVALGGHVDSAGRVPRRQRLRHRRQDRAGNRVSAPRILVVGASGMLGHEAIRVLAPDFEVWGACRRPEALPDLGRARRSACSAGSTRPMRESAYALVERVQPDLVINAVGIVKQRADANAAVPSIEVNSLWPHVLADACDRARRTHGARQHRLRVLGLARRLRRDATFPTPSTSTAARSCWARSPTARTPSRCARPSSAGSSASRPGWSGWFARAPRRAAQGLHQGGLQRADDARARLR